MSDRDSEGIDPNQSIEITLEDKGDIVQLDEDAVNDQSKIGNSGLLKSRFDEISPWRSLWVFRRSVWFVFVLTTMNMLDSWQIGIAGSLIVNKGFQQKFGTLQSDGTYDLPTTWVSAWGAIINVGQLASMFYVPYVGDRYGRKAVYWLCLLNYIACLFCLTFAETAGVWCLGKFFVGMAAGCVQMTTGPYLVEICPNNIRGALSVFPGLWSGVCGIANSVMMVVTNDRYPYNYRMPIWVLWGIVALFIASIAHLPESPWVYARHGNKKAGLHSLRRLYGNVEGFDFEEEWGIIVLTLEHERAVLAQMGSARWKDMFVGQNLKRSLLLVGQYTAQMWAGNSLIGTYGTYFFQIAGLSNPFLASMIQTCIGLGSTVIFSFLIEWVGRRRLACWSYTATSLSLFLIGGVYYIPNRGAGVALVALTCVWQQLFGLFTGVYGIQSSEIPSAHLRVKTNALALFVAACWGIITCFCVPPLLTELQERAAFVFGATSFPFIFFYWYFTPETKSRSAAEIDELFESSIPAWRWRKYRTMIQEQTHEAVVLQRQQEGLEMTQTV